MPIVVAHEPDPRLIGQAAFAAGMGQYRQQQFQNGLQVMQLALQERARQQQQAAQQQAMQQAAQQQAMDRAAQMQEMQARQQQAERQWQQQLQLRQMDQQADWQRQQLADQNRQSNYADLRTHQMQMLRERNSFDAVKGDTESRVKQLSQVQAGGLTTEGGRIADKLRQELQAITSRRQMGESDDVEYQAAIAKWDQSFNQHGDWSLLSKKPEEELRRRFDSSKFTHPEFGPGRMVAGRNGVEAFIPDAPVFRPGPNGQMLQAEFGADGTIKWTPIEQPKPAAPPKPAFTPKDVMGLAQSMYDKYMQDQDEYGERNADILAGEEKTLEDFFFQARRNLEMAAGPQSQPSPSQSPPAGSQQAPRSPVGNPAVNTMNAADADQARVRGIEDRLPSNPQAQEIYASRIKPSIESGIPVSDPRIAPWVDRVEKMLQQPPQASKPDPRMAPVVEMRKKLDPLMSPEQRAEWDSIIQPLIDSGAAPDDPLMLQAVKELTTKIRSRLTPGR